MWELLQLICFGVKVMESLAQIGFGLQAVLTFIFLVIYSGVAPRGNECGGSLVVPCHLDVSPLLHTLASFSGGGLAKAILCRALSRAGRWLIVNVMVYFIDLWIGHMSCSNYPLAKQQHYLTWLSLIWSHYRDGVASRIVQIFTVVGMEGSWNVTRICFHCGLSTFGRSKHFLFGSNFWYSLTMILLSHVA